MLSQEKLQRLIAKLGASEVVSLLAPHILEERKQKIEDVLCHRSSHVQVALEATYDIHNANAVIRTAECLGFDRLHMINAQHQFTQSRRITRGAGNWVHVAEYPRFFPFHQYLKNNDIRLAAASLNGQHEFNDLPFDKPICLILGNEHQGLSQQALDAADYHFCLPMYGMTQSYNLSVSAAICLFKLRERLESSEYSAKSNMEDRRAYYYIQSINPKHVKILMDKALQKQQDCTQLR